MGLLQEKGSRGHGVTFHISEGGVVTISGIVNTRQERERVIDLARKTPGITEVRPRINVRESWRTSPR